MTASKRFVGGIASDLQNAGEARQLPGDFLGAAAIGKHIGDRRRRWAAHGDRHGMQIRVRCRPGSSAGIGVSSQWRIESDPGKGVRGRVERRCAEIDEQRGDGQFLL
ncbi:hypothetical protein AS156_04630 [Bradyrhizobium macuxiense]|uniref:Uncharacterized protein n=1 Tax=Bradyrhizobium macuxiense TaxID=1755647 RepID=A0A109JWI7_9BRAD|nr:hypothetical protein AS156_04630 [Bradyrhizobium macuxiense]